MTLKDRFRRLRKGSVSADTSPKATTPAVIATPDGHSPNEALTPAATQTPTQAASLSDLTTIGDVLSHQATNGTTKKKKKRGLFRRKEDPYKDWPDDVYRPHEIPAPKYKRTPDPQHLENLSAFSFGDSAQKLVRRLSERSGVSPGGSKWASPFASKANSRAPSRLASRNPSIAEVDEGDSNASGSGTGGVGGPEVGTGGLQLSIGGRKQQFVDGQPIQRHGVDRVVEEDGEADGSNAGGISRPRTAQGDNTDGALSLTKTTTHIRSSNEMPFTEQELTQALTKATLQDDRRKGVETPPT